MQLNFFLREMTHLRYFIPIVAEGNKRDWKSTFYVVPSHKYNCPNLPKNLEDLYKICEEHDIDIRAGKEIVDAEGVIFTSEESGIDIIKKNTKAKKITMSYQTDFILSYKNYVDVVDHIMMPSRFIAEYYNLMSDKNLYLGSPKYDIEIDKQAVLKKYNFPDQKKVLIMLPKSRDAGKINLNSLCLHFKNCGYCLIFKARGKDPLSSQEVEHIRARGDFYFEDDSWYPHLSQELIEISDMIINFGSTSIEECVMHNTPLLNFDIKPEIRHGKKMPYRITHEYLYDYDFCTNVTSEIMPKISSKDGEFRDRYVTAVIHDLCTYDHMTEFQEARQAHLHDHKNTCKMLLDTLEGLSV